MTPIEPEIEYYREVEDLFSSLRGTPHVLSPRDFQLLRSWWRDEIPMAAVAAGLTEVFARNREREDSEPVVSLSYCRHAVKKHAKRLASMHVGGEPTGADASTASRSAVTLVDRLRSAAAGLTHTRPAHAEIIEDVVRRIEAVADELPADRFDEHLYGLETTMLAACWQALSADDRTAIDDRLRSSVASSAVTEEARRRRLRALRDREVRALLGLPRLELDG